MADIQGQMQNLLESDYCQDLPWCVDDVDKLGNVVTNFYYNQSRMIAPKARQWFQNVNFFYGNQNLRWSNYLSAPVVSDFMPLAGKRRSGAFRTQSNFIRVVGESLLALIASRNAVPSVSVKSKFSTMSSLVKPIAKARLDYFNDHLELPIKFREAALGLIVFSEIAGKVEYCRSKGYMQKYQVMQEVQQPVMKVTQELDPASGLYMEMQVPDVDPMTGQPVTQTVTVPKRDSRGNVVFNHAWSGDTDFRIVTPFELFRDYDSDFYESKRIGEVRIIDYDDWLSEYSELGGKTEYFDMVRPGASTDFVYQIMLMHFLRTKFMAPDGYSQTSSPFNSNWNLMNKVLIIEHYDRPHPQKWPNGRKLVIANGMCTHRIMKQDYYTTKKDGWHPYNWAGWLVCPPVSFANGPIDDVISKQQDINYTETLINTKLHRAFGGVTLVKTNAFDKDKLTGEPNQSIYTPNVNDAIRFAHDENAIEPAIPQIEDRKKDDLFTISGAQEAIRGERSENASSGFAQKVIDEREQRRLTPGKRSLEQYVKKAYEKIQACDRATTNFSDPRVQELLKTALGNVTASQLKIYMDQAIDLGLDISIDADSMAYESEAAKKAEVRELLGTPFGQIVFQSPELTDRFKDFFGLDDFKDQQSLHVDNAQCENDAFFALLYGSIDTMDLNAMPKVIPEQSDDIHLAEHDKFIITNQKSLENNPELFQLIITHKQHHEDQKIRKQMAQANNDMQSQQMFAQMQMQKQMMMGQPPQGGPVTPPGGPGQAISEGQAAAQGVDAPGGVPQAPGAMPVA